jgi:hypothetical protein
MIMIKRLGMGGVSNISSVGSKDLRQRDSGFCFFSTKAEMGTGSERNRDLAGRGENTGERQAGVDRMSMVELRGGDGTRDNLLDKGTILTVDSMSGSEGDESRVSTRVDTSKAGGEGEHEGVGVVGNCEGMGSKGRNTGVVDGEEGREGNNWGQGVMT